MDETNKTKKVYARLPAPLQERARLEAIRRGTTLDKLIGSALAYFLKHSPKVVSS